MRRLRAVSRWVVVIAVGAAWPALAQLCADDRASCREDCSIEYGTSITGRAKLGRCMERCDAKFSRCEVERVARKPARPKVEETAAVEESAPAAKASARPIESLEDPEPAAPPKKGKLVPAATEMDAAFEDEPSGMPPAKEAAKKKPVEPAMEEQAPPARTAGSTEQSAVKDELEPAAPPEPMAPRQGTTSSRISGLDVRPAMTAGERKANEAPKRSRLSRVKDEAPTTEQPEEPAPAESMARSRLSRGRASEPEKPEVPAPAEQKATRPVAGKSAADAAFEDEEEAAAEPKKPAVAEPTPEPPQEEEDGIEIRKSYSTLPEKEPVPPGPGEKKPAEVYTPKKDISEWDPDE